MDRCVAVLQGHYFGRADHANKIRVAYATEGRRQRISEFGKRLSISLDFPERMACREPHRRYKTFSAEFFRSQNRGTRRLLC